MFFLEILLLTLGVVFLIGALDDFFVDLVHFFARHAPRRLSSRRWMSWRNVGEKPLAIMIPAWQESAVLESMVRTNLARIRYGNYRWYLGVYPNDPETVDIAKRLEAQYPERITVVVTDRPGPTSKAHCLNCILRVMEVGAWVPHYIAIHDAEDVIHPEAFRAINGQPPDLDFIQLPVFSLEVPLKSWVAGTYLDEFAEIHLKELLVRQWLGMPIPSAGVGTFFSRKILADVKKEFGYWFDEGNLTEDYEISYRIARMGGKQLFLLVEDQAGEIIATREFFPDEYIRSVRQKTRWTTGIGFQTFAKWGVYGVLANARSIWTRKGIKLLYALWRDRKTLWANPANVLAFVAMPPTVVAIWLRPEAFGISGAPVVVSLLLLNLALFGVRIVQRMRFCAALYGRGHGALALPRILLSNLINASACIKAYRTYFSTPVGAAAASRKIEWDKTDHKFPDLAAIEAQGRGRVALAAAPAVAARPMRTGRMTPAAAHSVSAQVETAGGVAG